MILQLGMRSLTTILTLLLPLSSNAFPTNSSNTSGSVQNILLEWFKTSNLAANLHAKHIASPQVEHMMKSTPLVKAPDAEKLQFAESYMGRLVSDMMLKEQRLLGRWKVQKIVEAATKDGKTFQAEAAHSKLLHMLGENKATVTLFSFVDCPWCLLAKKLLREEPYRSLLGNRNKSGNEMLQIIELEEFGWEGKELRASIALATGRTSMPACFIGGFSVGGYTDGFGEIEKNKYKNIDDNNIYVPDADIDLRLRGATGLKSMHESGQLLKLIKEQKP